MEIPRGDTSLEHLFSVMQAHGSSVTLNWGEDNERWEVAWITSGTRYIGVSKESTVATQQAISQAMVGRLTPPAR